MSLNYNRPVVSRPFPFSPLQVLSLALAVLVALPVLAVGVNLFTAGTGDTWGHLMATVLPEYVANSVWLCLGVGIGVAAMGTGAAWLVALNDFPGRRIAEWALLLPMAMPAYVLAYTYTDFLQFVGPVQTGLRETFGWHKDDYWFPGSAFAGRRHRAVFLRALSLCLPAGAHRVPGARRRHDRGGPRPWASIPGRASGVSRFLWRGLQLPPAWRSR